MRITITGATGLIGRQLVKAAQRRGDEVVALGRSAERTRERLGSQVEVHEWREPKRVPPPAAALAGAEAVINLIGEPVSQRWSDEAKKEIVASRVRSTRQLVAALTALPAPQRPGVLVSGSATGLYGPRGEEPVAEDSPPGHDFLAKVVLDWEAAAREAEELGIRVAYGRTGVVLATGEGALAKMLPPFRLGLGGPVAGGRQYVPWIHIDDVVGALLFCATEASADGPFNLAAPNPATNAELSHALGRVLHRPSFMPVPSFAVGLLYGEMASIVTTGARVEPRRLQELGYSFRQPELEPALRDVLGGG